MTIILTGLESLRDDQLRALPKEQQKAYIIAWFHSQFREPGREHLYGGIDGAYQFSQGGPYEARAELKIKFGGVVVLARTNEMTTGYT